MKKALYLTLAVIAMTLVACNSKPAEEQSAEESQTIEAVEPVAEEAPALETEEPLEADSLAAEPADSIAAEEPAAEEPAEQPAPEEPATEEPVEEQETVWSFVDDVAVPSFTKDEMPKLFVVNLNDVDPEADECRVIVTFVVEKDGRITHPTVRRSTCDNEKLDAYALQHVLDKCPRFKEPGKKSGHPVRSSYSVPISFKKL